MATEKTESKNGSKSKAAVNPDRLFLGMWFLLDMIASHRDILAANEKPSKDLRKIMRQLESIVQFCKENENKMAPKADLSRLFLVEKYHKPLEKIYWKVKGKGAQAGISEEEQGRLVTEMLSQENFGEALKEIIRKLVVTKETIIKDSGPADSARNRLGIAFGIGGRRHVEDLSKQKGKSDHKLPTNIDLEELLRPLLRATTKYSDKQIESAIAFLQLPIS